MRLLDEFRARLLAVASRQPIAAVFDPPEVRVARGAALLDRWRPGWALLVTRPVWVPSALDCPVGQTYGNYSTAPAELRTHSAACGFIALHHADIHPLNACWETEAASRRSPLQARHVAWQAARVELEVERVELEAELARMVADEAALEA